MKIIRSVEVKDKFEVKLEPYAEVLGVYVLEGKPYVSFLAEDTEVPEVVPEADTAPTTEEVNVVRYRFISVAGKHVPDGIEHDGKSLVFVGSYVKEDTPVHVFEVVD